MTPSGYTRHQNKPQHYQGPRSAVRFEKLSDHLAAAVTNVDLSRPVTEDEWADIHDAWVVHGVLVFREQDLPPAMHVAFSTRFGSVIRHPVSRFGLPDFPEITVLSNVVGTDGQKIGADRAGMVWHSDMSFFAEPSMGSLLYGVECPPEGADTEFTSTYAAFTALPEADKGLLATLEGVHDYAWHYRTYLSHRPPLTDEEKAKAPVVTHPALRTHPVTGWNTTYLSEGLTAGIVGMAPDEGRELVVRISEFAAQPAFVYRHKWRPGDLVFWDNRSTMHRATDFRNDYRRVMRRTTVRGDRPYFAGLH